ncbi:Major Facilitator Superfamily protein [Pyrenophora tritici-repentis]|uniref:Major Facilitator Superfamily protein n=2 Tax=Pyrenophora tritici-repentis TaxID=45151 RepID=A0A2W1D210_9PLEO|nr:uncharacterized protein PTRG_05330 [Pyrenophora tritici-repentis Pt-1C-BFP]KAA8618387.1 Major Facilitator Superfamily protein [Pyrenophora tritici-repentis]EDU48250.1 conserved hypothetical protein [Pyrenophora tritici-repentis Pt-1C-BFP]KAF7448860.1 Major Facilitator Superfamily protein [Pyrenophora tritici-repentis]KAF7571148.1 Major Facilitator Superfamily protein [Pyrenophora tritici-repentis]KAG9384196.1 Major Facilitator Superfamily protein [Pyrenophora tritici-repentis]
MSSYCVESARTTPPQSSVDDEKDPSTHAKVENAGEVVTRTQQWRILSSTCLVAITVIGLNQTFGVFQAYYGRQKSVQEGVLAGDDFLNRPLISTVGSMSSGGLVAAFGIFYYPYLPVLGCHVRSLCAAATAFVTLGFFGASMSHNLASIIGCQGTLVGIGSGILIYVLGPILPEYFPQRGGLAQGVMYASAALGGMIWSFALTGLLETVGIRWTLGSVALVNMVILGIASVLALPPRRFKKRSTHIIGWKTIRDPLFLSLAIVNLTQPLVLTLPMGYGPIFAESLGVSISKASYLVAINSGVGVLVRPGTGWLADRFGYLNMLMIATAVYCLATFTLWLPAATVSNVGLYIGMCVFHGLVNGVFLILINTAQKTLFGAEMYYPKSGAMTSIRGVGLVISAPIAGALLPRKSASDLQGRDFTGLILYTGLMLIVSLLALGHVRWLDAKRNGWKLAR